MVKLGLNLIVTGSIDCSVNWPSIPSSYLCTHEILNNIYFITLNNTITKELHLKEILVTFHIDIIR